MPNLNVETLVKSMLAKTNDMHLAVYCASLVRAIVALHDLVNNKALNKTLEATKEEQEVAKAQQEVAKKPASNNLAAAAAAPKSDDDDDDDDMGATTGD